MFQIVASDLDGTLLNSEHKLSSYTKKILQKLRKNQVNFVFATGRHHIDVAQMRENMEIDAFMITSNGARVHDSKGNLVYAKSLEPDLASQLAQMVIDNHLIRTHVYRGDEWMINKEDAFSLSYYKESAFKYSVFNPLDFDTSEVAKVYFTTTDDSYHPYLVKLKTQLETKFGEEINITFSTLNCLEVMAKGVSKGHALEAVAKLLNLTLEDCIAFGDGMNDVEMLSMVGKGCIMQNATSDLKKHLPNLEIIGSNVDESVPHYLNSIFFNDN